MKAIKLFVLAYFAIPAAVPSQVISVKRAPKVTSIDGVDLQRGMSVLKRFFRSEAHPECYSVLFSTFEGNLRIDFEPKRPELIRIEGEPADPHEKAACGRNIGYVIDKRGKILRRIFSR